MPPKGQDVSHLRSLPAGCLGLSGSSAGKESARNSGDPSLIPGWGRSPGEGIGYPLQYSRASLVIQSVKNLPTMRETWLHSLGGKKPWRRAWQPTPVFLPRESPRAEGPGRLAMSQIQLRRSTAEQSRTLGIQQALNGEERTVGAGRAFVHHRVRGRARRDSRPRSRQEGAACPHPVSWAYC